MSKYKANPADVRQYFDLQTIRNYEQVVFKGTLHTNETALFLTHSFEVNEQIRLIYKGSTLLRFALFKEAKNAFGSQYVDVASEDEAIVDASITWQFKQPVFKSSKYE